jgi:hypothetical protein
MCVPCHVLASLYLEGWHFLSGNDTSRSKIILEAIQVDTNEKSCDIMFMELSLEMP